MSEFTALIGLRVDPKLSLRKFEFAFVGLEFVQNYQ